LVAFLNVTTQRPRFRQPLGLLPMTITQKLRLLPDQELIEFFCTDNEKDRQRYVTTK